MWTNENRGHYDRSKLRYAASLKAVAAERVGGDEGRPAACPSGIVPALGSRASPAVIGFALHGGRLPAGRAIALVAWA